MDQPLSSRYYDEDELIDIFDYASDIADDAVRAEVILMAQRLCPDSRDLAERKAMLYWSMGNDKAAAKVMKSLPSGRFLSRLTKLRIDKGKNGLTAKDLSLLIKSVKPDSLPDEEVIQLIDAAEDSEQQQWLVDNYDRLKTLAQYPETLMYDLVDPILDWSGDADFEFVNQLLDDLTMTPPYDLGYWEFAAQTAMDRQDDPERALGFVEYALAINPNSVKSLVIKSECLLRAQKPDVVEALKTARSAYMAQPDSLDACFAYSHALESNNRTDEAIDVYKRYLKTANCDLSVVVSMASLCDNIDLYSLLKSAIENVDANEREHQLDAVLTGLVSKGCYEYVAQTMQLIEELGFEDNYKPEFMVELYFRTDRLEKALPYLMEAHPFDNRTWLIALLMSLPMPEKDKALEVIDERMPVLDATIEQGSLPDVIEAQAIKAYAKMIRHCIATDAEFEIDKFSPFITELPLKL